MTIPGPNDSQTWESAVSAFLSAGTAAGLHVREYSGNAAVFQAISTDPQMSGCRGPTGQAPVGVNFSPPLNKGRPLVHRADYFKPFNN